MILHATTRDGLPVTLIVDRQPDDFEPLRVAGSPTVFVRDGRQGSRWIEKMPTDVTIQPPPKDAT